MPTAVNGNEFHLHFGVVAPRPPTVVANCLTRPTSMTLDKKTGTLYVSELAGAVRSILIP